MHISPAAVAVAASVMLINGLLSLCLRLDLHWPLAVAVFRQAHIFALCKHAHAFLLAIFHGAVLNAEDLPIVPACSYDNELQSICAKQVHSAAHAAGLHPGSHLHLPSVVARDHVCAVYANHGLLRGSPESSIHVQGGSTACAISEALTGHKNA